MKVLKKDRTQEEYNFQKIRNAVTKSASRVMVTLTDTDFNKLQKIVEGKLEELELETISINDMHSVVEGALEELNPLVAKSYRDYRNYKADFVHVMDAVYRKS